MSGADVTMRTEKPAARGRMATLLGGSLNVLVLSQFAFLLVPGVNPARICQQLNANLSLFTSGFFYKSLIGDISRLLAKGWIMQSTIQLLFFASMAACIGILVGAAGACMSLGNNRLKRIGFIFAAAGGFVVCLGMIGVAASRAHLIATASLERVTPLDPAGMKILLWMGVGTVVLSFINLLLARAPARDERAHMEAPMELFLLLLPFLLLVFVFSYLPLFGWRYGFFYYHAGETLSLSRFAGFFWFTFLFQNAATVNDIIRVLKNTLAMSGLGILTSWCPMAFAIFLAEIRNTRFRRVVQTLTTIPNFISWVLVYAVAFCIFSTDGFLSSMMVNLGIWDAGKNMLMGDQNIWLKMLGWGMWKGLGWSAIMYIAAITSIDPQLYEAAMVDGAGRFRKMWHITVPELIPTYMVMLLLSIASLLNNGMEQYLVFKNATNTGPITVLDLYVFNIGIEQGSIPLSTVVGMVKSLVSVVLLFGANSISKLIRGVSIV
jgi:putative aldouronate transport system permease protein